MNKLTRQVDAVTEVLRDYLPVDMAEERARNIVQALGDGSDEQSYHGEYAAVWQILLEWEFRPRGWKPPVEQMITRILRALHDA